MDEKTQALFELDPDPTFAAVVAIPKPGGGAKTLEVTFKWMSRDAWAEHCKSAVGKKDVEFIAEMLAGWNNASEPYSADALEKLFAFHPRAGRAFFDAYERELFGAETKN